MHLLLVGIGAGVVLSLPSTGPVDLLVLRHVLSGDPWRGLRIAIGSAIVDIPYAWLGALGYGFVLARSALATAGLDLLAAVLLVGVAVHFVRAPVGVEAAPADGAPASDLATGAVIGALNASRLLSWSVAASVLAGPLDGAGPLALLVYAVGTSVGEVLWFGLLATLRSRLGPASATFHRWTVRGAAAVALVLAATMAFRSLHALVPLLRHG